jgi:hypothetical protein
MEREWYPDDGCRTFVFAIFFELFMATSTTEGGSLVVCVWPFENFKGLIYVVAFRLLIILRVV